jgi:hypothetical protein
MDEMFEEDGNHKDDGEDDQDSPEFENNTMDTVFTMDMSTNKKQSNNSILLFSIF